MNRRPHWDDTLVYAVIHEIGVLRPSPHSLRDTSYAVIAAVEDWHKAKRDSRVRTHSEGCWRWHNECAESLIEWQQAAIARVRELHRKGEMHDICVCCHRLWPCATIRAIDGGAE